MGTILDKILERKKREVENAQKVVSIAELQDSEVFNREIYSFPDFINQRSGVIAEFKRRSPSKGLINGHVKIEDVVTGYESASASAISVLTDTRFFGGTLNDLRRARAVVNCPLLRKDFMIDPYQLFEAKAYGADIILLIAAGLELSKCNDLAAQAKELELNVFLEIHNEDELKYMSSDVDVIGINNRNLKTFEVDIENSKALFNQLPKDIPAVAESGISDHSLVTELRAHGFHGFLIGENFMRSGDPGKACESFIHDARL